jgi:ABC-type transport system involved in multi-copper enzyme maturation permease subunit
MSLFRFELRKLLFNKRTAILLICLLALYSIIGFATSIFLIGSNDSYRAYEELAAAYEGPLDMEKAAEAELVYDEISARYGTDSQVIARSIKDQPETILAVKYHDFADTVDDYWNGTPPESAEEPYGIALLQSKLAELESQGKQNTFEYKGLSSSLQTLIELGEPEFANILLWENLFINWGEHMMQFLLFIPLAFVIAPVFAVERSTGMDNLILSSRNGRRKIVTAKLLSVLVASTVVVGLYVIATFVFGFLPHASLHGWNAAIQSIPTYARSMFGFEAWQFAIVAAAWLIFTGAIYSLIIGFISSRMKIQMGTVGVGLAILFINVGLAAMGDTIIQRIQPIIDFGLANVTLIKEVFGGYKVFNLFGMGVSYPVAAIFVLGVIAILAVLGIYRGQKSRTVA